MESPRLRPLLRRGLHSLLAGHQPALPLRETRREEEGGVRANRNSMTDQNEAPEPQTEEQLRRREYLDERNLLIKGETESAQGFDKTLITLSAGALGLTVPFIRYLAPQQKRLDFLFLAWTGFLVSLFCVLLSYFFAQLAYRRALKNLDVLYYPKNAGSSTTQEDQRNRWTPVIYILSVASIASLVFGVFFFLRFALKNLGG